MRKSTLVITAVAAAVLVSSSVASVKAHQTVRGASGMSQNIVQDAVADPQLSTLVSLVKKAGLVSALANAKAHLTVFAPTNAAFASLKKADPMTFNAVATTPALLKKILTYHVLGTEVNAAAAIAVAAKHGSVATLEGEKITLSIKAGELYLNRSAQVIKTNIAASNGIVHVINAVLIPPSVKVIG
jgi:transforming growth factor-beta-induced protein